MHNHRVNELLELLKPYWLKEPTLSLTQTLQKIAAEAGSEAPLAELGDEVIIYQLKMSTQDKLAPIPGLQKDYEEDFKSALLKARGICAGLKAACFADCRQTQPSNWFHTVLQAISLLHDMKPVVSP